MCSESKQNEESELTQVSNIDIVVAGQGLWKNEDSRINVDGYTWFWKACDVQNNQRQVRGVIEVRHIF